MKKEISLRAKIILFSTLVLFSLLLIIFALRLIVDIGKLRKQTEDQGWQHAKLVGEMAEGLFLEESFEEMQPRLERSFDIIDVDNKEKISNTWKKFVYNNHGSIYQNINDTWLFRYPRRTTTVLWEKMMMLRHNREEMPFEDFRGIQELYEFVKPLIDEEEISKN